jgi:hypothetical protein
MGGFIILDDGRAYTVANRAFRATIAAVVESLPQTPQGRELAKWLQNDPSVQIYYHVDVRELTAANKMLFLHAIEVAYEEATCGPDGWQAPDGWAGWISRFSDLIKMIGCVERGEPPGAFNPHMVDVIPPTDRRSGPGW